jgi:hypothetical protein
MLSDPNQAESVPSPGEIQATIDRPYLACANLGKVIARLTAQDPDVASIFQHLGGPGQLDFVYESGLG